MMRSYVCQQCRLQLRRPLLAPRYPQLSAGRTIVSFRNKQPSTTQEAPLRSSEGTSNRHNTAQGGGQKSVDSEAQRQQETSHEDLPPADVPMRHHGASTRQTKTTPVAQKIHDNLEYKSSEGTKAAWSIFDKTYTSRDVPALTDPSFADVHHLAAGKIFLRLSNFICHEFQRGNTEVPTPTELLFRYEKLGITPLNAWKQAIANMTYQLLVSMAKDTNTMDKAQEPAPTKKRSTEELMTELLSMWKLFFQRFGAHNGLDDLESISPEWKNIPETEVAFRTGKNFGSRLQEFHPAHATSPELQFSAITIFNYLSTGSSSPSASLQQLLSENKIFFNLITSTLAGAEVHKALGHLDGDPRIKRNLSEDFRRSMAVQIDSAPDLARKINGLDVSNATPEQQASHMVNFFLSRISRQVYMQANSTQLEKLWAEAEKHYKVSEKKSQIPSEVYNAFLSGFMTLYKPDSTVRVWNHMVAHGLKPTIDTWLSMLMGCGKAKDLTGLNAVWERMIHAGVEPDQRCWSMRIHTLISCREVSAGLAALDEMGSRWLAVEKEKQTPPSKVGKKVISKAKIVNNRTKPEVGAINGAVDAIVGLPTKGKIKSQSWKGMPHEVKVSYVHKVLQWAGNFDIKPDTRTYNALISLYLDGNDYTTAFRLIRQMEKEGIEGDLATHSMLLRAAFDNHKFDGLPPQEQADQIIKLFEELEQGGMRPNGFLYQTSIDRLLKQYSNVMGVRAVMEHMISRGFAPGPQIFTSLVTHYFQQEPPAIKEVDNLVALLFGPPAQPTDMYLFDRIIEGYARNDSIGSMMTVLTKMGAQGKKPSFRALSDVVRALYRQGDWERARSVIRDVRHGEGIAKTGPMSTHNVDRDQFFYTINALCPELLETSAGEHLKVPVQPNNGAVSDVGQPAQTPTNGSPASISQEFGGQEQKQQSFGKFLSDEQLYDRDANGQSPYNQSPFGQVEHVPHQQEQMPLQPTPYDQPTRQDNPAMDEEFMNAEHTSYLSDNPEIPQQRWESNNQTRKHE